jgi:hypothetical protein
MFLLSSALCRNRSRISLWIEEAMSSPHLRSCYSTRSRARVYLEGGCLEKICTQPIITRADTFGPGCTVYSGALILAMSRADTGSMLHVDAAGSDRRMSRLDRFEAQRSEHRDCIHPSPTRTTKRQASGNVSKNNATAQCIIFRYYLQYTQPLTTLIALDTTHSRTLFSAVISCPCPKSS